MFIVPPPYPIIKAVSDLLPYTHDVAHNILSMDKQLIHWSINSNLTHQTKAFIILFSIQLARLADHIGSDMMTSYYNLMKYLLSFE